MAEVVCWNCEAAIGEEELSRLPEEVISPYREDRILCENCDDYIQSEEIAAAHVADVQPDDLSLPVVQGARSFHKGGGLDMLVVEDDNLEAEYKAACATLVDEIVLADAPENLKRYFNYDAFAEDSRADGYPSAFGYAYGEEVTVYGCMYHVFYH